MLDPNAVSVGIAALAGVLGMPVYQAIKKLLNLEDNVALAGAAIFSLVLAGVLSYVGGAFGGLAFTLPDIIKAAGIVFTAATLLYKAIVKGKKPTDPDDEFPPA